MIPRKFPILSTIFLALTFGILLNAQVSDSINFKCHACHAAVEGFKFAYERNVTSDKIIEFAIFICKTFTHHEPLVCQGMTSQFRAQFLYVVEKLIFAPAQLCGMLMNDCGTPHNPFNSNWTIPLPPKPKENPYDKKDASPGFTKNQGKQTFRVLQLSDLHFDTFYQPGAESVCLDPICCQADSTNMHQKNPKTRNHIIKPAGYWGTIGKCDVPYWTIENMLKHINGTEKVLPLMADSIVDVGDGRALVATDQRKGDVISPTRAVLTLSKSMFNAGCFSLPYAWKLGGLWTSFVLTFFIAGFNWYGNHILVRSSQHLAKKTEKSALDYGHFAKKVCDHSSIGFLQRNSKSVMAVVNITILFYQLGMCSVAILFISDNMVNLLGDYFTGTFHEKMVIMATIATVFILITNMFTEMRIISVFAMISSIFFLIGTAVIMQYTVQRPNQWANLPASTNFTDTIVFIGMSMYAFEGQTMILPVENKLATPEDFLSRFGVLPTTMSLCTIFMVALGFYGYTGFGDAIAPTITTNVPKIGLYSAVNVCLMLQSMLGHSIAMYVVFDMFYKGFQRKFLMRFPNTNKQVIDKSFRIFWVLLTYFMAVLIPKLEIMIPLVGVTSGTLCALVYPPLFQIITFWEDWKLEMTPRHRWFRIGINVAVMCIGFIAIGAGLYANIQMIKKAFF